MTTCVKSDLVVILNKPNLHHSFPKAYSHHLFLIDSHVDESEWLKETLDLQGVAVDRHTKTFDLHNTIHLLVELNIVASVLAENM